MLTVTLMALAGLVAAEFVFLGIWIIPRLIRLSEGSRYKGRLKALAMGAAAFFVSCGMGTHLELMTHGVHHMTDVEKWQNIIEHIPQVVGGWVAIFLARRYLDVQFHSVDQISEQQRMEQLQRMESVGEMAGGLAHDFNTLLGIIVAYTDFASKDADDNKALNDDLHEVKTAAQQGMRLTRQLITFAKGGPVENDLLNLNDVIERILPMLGRARGNNAQVTADLASRAHVYADRSRLEQVILNLVVNACDAGAKHIAVSTADAKRHVVLTVTDDGSGMTAAVKKKIFDPFFTTKGPDHGSGMGLAVLYGIVQQAQGTVDVASKEGDGSTFVIRLPRA